MFPYTPEASGRDCGTRAAPEAGGRERSYTRLTQSQSQWLHWQMSETSLQERQNAVGEQKQERPQPKSWYSCARAWAQGTRLLHGLRTCCS